MLDTGCVTNSVGVNNERKHFPFSALHIRDERRKVEQRLIQNCRSHPRAQYVIDLPTAACWAICNVEMRRHPLKPPVDVLVAQTRPERVAEQIVVLGSCCSIPQDVHGALVVDVKEDGFVSEQVTEGVYGEEDGDELEAQDLFVVADGEDVEEIVGELHVARVPLVVREYHGANAAGFTRSVGEHVRRVSVM